MFLKLVVVSHMHLCYVRYAGLFRRALSGPRNRCDLGPKSLKALTEPKHCYPQDNNNNSGDYYMYFNDWMDMVVIVLIATNRPTLFVTTTAAASHSCSMLSALCVEYMSVLMMYAFVYIFLLSARGRKTMGWYFGPKLFDIFVEEKIVVLRW